jgi:hypothetical protein
LLITDSFLLRLWPGGPAFLPEFFLATQHEQSIPLRDVIEGYPWADLKIGLYIRARRRKYQELENRK